MEKFVKKNIKAEMKSFLFIQVRQLVWSPDDTRLFSCGMDGAVYEWEVATSKRLHEAVLKACGYTGLGLNADAKTVFAVGTDRKIKEIVDAQVSPFVII